MGIEILKGGLRPIKPGTFEIFPEPTPEYVEPQQQSDPRGVDKWTPDYLDKFNRILVDKAVPAKASPGPVLEFLYPASLQPPAAPKERHRWLFKLPWVLMGTCALGFVFLSVNSEPLQGMAGIIIMASFLGLLASIAYLGDLRTKHSSRTESIRKERDAFAQRAANEASRAETELDRRLAAEEYEKAKQLASAEYMERKLAWEGRRNRFYQGLSHVNLLVQRVEAALGLWMSDSFRPKADYSPDERILITEGWLPNSQVVESALRRTEKKPSQKLIQETYDDILYQSCLRAVHEACSVDFDNLVDIVVFNGCVQYIDPATGKQLAHCVLSLQVTKQNFMSLNLAQVDPRTCFRALKGIAGGKLFNMTPVKPILQLNTQDKRFVPSYDIAGTLDGSLNLAAMDWLDFENLIREIFGKEFKALGGEVKLTQSSRDGGVDAVAFDPDPIRGGKIVIQAKRYTNVVGVSAVRDLYGTVVNEGANKGILVTTSYYGTDAYEFAKDKPITLINGSHLLHLLQKHGYAARIDLKEAKATHEEPM